MAFQLVRPEHDTFSVYLHLFVSSDTFFHFDDINFCEFSVSNFEFVDSLPKPQ